jgi:hypothetical protein
MCSCLILSIPCLTCHHLDAGGCEVAGQALNLLNGHRGTPPQAATRVTQQQHPQVIHTAWANSTVQVQIESGGRLTGLPVCTQAVAMHVPFLSEGTEQTQVQMHTVDAMCSASRAMCLG